MNKKILDNKINNECYECGGKTTQTNGEMKCLGCNSVFTNLNKMEVKNGKTTNR